MWKSKRSGRIVAITGASGGIGNAAAEAFLANGDTVYSLSRTAPRNEKIAHIPCDITDEASVSIAVDALLHSAMRIDVLLLNAGIGISGSIEHTPISEVIRQFDVSLFGNVRVLQKALPFLRQTGGCVLFTSSVAANVAIPFQAYYSAVKAGTSMLTLALANELSDYPVRVAAVLPGDVKTGFTNARRKCKAGCDVYPAMERAVSRMEHDEQTGMAPARIAKKILRLSLKKHPKPLSTVGLSYQCILLLSKLLPVRLSNRLVGKLYQG